MSGTSSKKFFSHKTIKIILTTLQYFYLVSGIIVLLVFIVNAVSGSVLSILLPSPIVAAIIAYGIYNKASWTPFVVTILAAFSIISNGFRLPGEPLVSGIVIIILIAEIYFFNHKDVKELFKVKNTTSLF